MGAVLSERTAPIGPLLHQRRQQIQQIPAVKSALLHRLLLPACEKAFNQVAWLLLWLLLATPEKAPKQTARLLLLLYRLLADPEKTSEKPA